MPVALVLPGLWVMAGSALRSRPLRDTRQVARARAARRRQRREEQAQLVE